MPPPFPPLAPRYAIYGGALFRSFQGLTRRILLVPFGKMRKKETRKKNEIGGGRGGGWIGSEFCGPRVRLKYLRYARNNGNNIGCLATALFTTSSTFSARTYTLAPPSPSQLTHSLPLCPCISLSCSLFRSVSRDPIFRPRTSLAERQRWGVIDSGSLQVRVRKELSEKRKQRKKG